MADLQARKLQKIHMLSAQKVALTAMDADLKRKRDFLEPLMAMHERSCEVVAAQQRRTKSLEPIKLSGMEDLSSLGLVQEQLELVKETLKARTRDAIRAAMMAMSEEERHVKTQRDIVGDTYEGVKEIVEAMEVMRREWAAEVERLKMWIEAADYTIEMVIMQAIESEKDNPYLDLWADIWETLKVRDVMISPNY